MIAKGRVSKLAREWSNAELRRFAHRFTGDAVNVSGWRDEDKQGAHYRDYFTGAASYTLTNYKADARGLQGLPGEIFLDLEAPLEAHLRRRFDLVFNHTALEHIYEFQTAFANLCEMSRDAVVIVVPWLQPYHGDYGDYWRFSPLAVRRMYEANGLTPVYISYNEGWLTSVYIFAIGVRDPAAWADVEPPAPREVAGLRALPGLRRLVKGLVRRR